MVKADPPVRVDPELRLWIGGPGGARSGRWVLMRDRTGLDDEQREDLPRRAAVGVGTG